MLELISKIWTYGNPFVVAAIAYFFAVKSKRKDIDIEKEKKLNAVLSDMLMVYHYLSNLENVSDLNKLDLSIPKKAIPYFLLQSGALNDGCFKSLENAVETLKEYDPVTYYELEGIGKALDCYKSNLLLPFLNVIPDADLNRSIAERVINDTLDGLEPDLLRVAKQVSRKTYRGIKKKINNHLSTDPEEIKEILIEEFYDLISSVVPEKEMPDIEQFEKDLSDPEYQKFIEKEYSFLIEKELNEIIAIVADNPGITLEELREKINQPK